MKTEAELRALLADIDLVNEDEFTRLPIPSLSAAFRHGLSAGICEALDQGVERCGNPDCIENHREHRIRGMQELRDKAAKIRATRAVKERARRQ